MHYDNFENNSVENLQIKLMLKIAMHIQLHSCWDTDLGRSIAVVTDSIYVIRGLNRFTGSQPSHQPLKPCNKKDTHLKCVNNPLYEGRGQ